MMKNAFYFMLKALFVLEIFAFSFWLFGCVEKLLDKKATFNKGRLVPDLFMFLEKALYKAKASDQHLSFHMFWYSLIGTYNKNKVYNI